MNKEPQTFNEAADDLHAALCALWDKVAKVLRLKAIVSVLNHILLTLRLWRYQVGARSSWVDGWLLLRGYAIGHRLTFREAWAVTSVLFR